MVFDLDPTSGKFADAAKAGIVVKNELDHLGLTSFPKTSGSRGLHVFVPLRLGPTYDEVLPFAKQICERLAADHPKELTVEQRIDARGQRVYLDPFRNAFGATVVAPYSVRRRAKAPFSMPLNWPDVKPSLDPSDFNLGNFEKALAGPDPWKDFFKSRQSLSAKKILARKKHPPSSCHQRVRHHAGAYAARSQQRQPAEKAQRRGHDGQPPVWKLPERKMHQPKENRRCQKPNRFTMRSARNHTLQKRAKEKLLGQRHHPQDPPESKHQERNELPPGEWMRMELSQAHHIGQRGPNGQEIEKMLRADAPFRPRGHEAKMRVV